MRVKLFKCGICHHWYLLSHGHCAVCNSARIVILGRAHYINIDTGREVVRSMTLSRSIAATYTGLLASLLES